MLFDIELLKVIFGPINEVTGDWRNIHD